MGTKAEAIAPPSTRVTPQWLPRRQSGMVNTKLDGFFGTGKLVARWRTNPPALQIQVALAQLSQSPVILWAPGDSAVGLLNEWPSAVPAQYSIQ